VRTADKLLDIRGLGTKSGFSLLPGGGLTAIFFWVHQPCNRYEFGDRRYIPLKIHRFRENDQHSELGIGVGMMS
jgi:hypothetical protein